MNSRCCHSFAWILILGLLTSARAFNQQIDINKLLLLPADKGSSFNDSIPANMFKGISPLELSILTNFDSLRADAYVGEMERNALLSWKSPANKVVTERIHISVRGNFRLKPANCDFPPLRISFLKSDSARLLFRENQQIKLITHCQTDSDIYEQFVLEEYLIYRMYQLLSDYAFKVRLIKFSYINTGHRTDTIIRFGFALESPGSLAARYQSRRIKSNNVDLKIVNQRYFQLLCFFQYMIMNNDWAVEIAHNVELLQNDSTISPIPVPYDFDWAGIIGIPYKIPALHGTTALKPERIFKGDYHRRKDLKGMIQFYNSKRGDLYALVSGFNQLNEASRIKIIMNLDTFYTILNHRSLFNSEILKK